MVLLIDVENHREHDSTREVHHLALPVDELGGQQMIVDEKHDEEGQELLPYGQDFRPVEGIVGIGYTHAETDDGRQEQHGP